MMEYRKGVWMQTFTGRMFWPLDPREDEIHMEDIAHSLALQCRYAGHTREFYSVAQHCVLASKIVPAEDAAWALLHDASEAYLVDLPRPIKRYSDMGTLYLGIEERVMDCVIARFNLAPIEPVSVHEADQILMVTEARDLMAPPPMPWRCEAVPLVGRITPWSPTMAEAEFMERALELGVWA